MILMACLIPHLMAKMKEKLLDKKVFEKDILLVMILVILLETLLACLKDNGKATMLVILWENLKDQP